jgi:hypothetical protein
MVKEVRMKTRTFREISCVSWFQFLFSGFDAWAWRLETAATV